MEFKIMDGDVVKLIDGSLWLVSWNIHDVPYSIIALPYYVIRNGKKIIIESMLDALEYAREKYPYLMEVIESYDRILPKIRRNIVKKVFSASKYLTETLLSSDEVSRLIKEFVFMIASEAGISVDSLGITFIPEELKFFKPKVYLIVYDESIGLKVYNALRRLFFTTMFFEHLKGDYVHSKLKNYGIYVKVSTNTLNYLYSRKVLSGIFYGKLEYHVKILRNITYSFAEFNVQNLGRVVVLAKVLNDKYSLFTPAEYDIQVIDVAEGDFRARFASKVVAYNEGYKEHLWKGASVLIQGRLEKVQNIAEDEEYYRITVGFSKDILLPTRRLYTPLEP
ncbi:MAG: hypothetical protein DRN04_15530 [Thermoprotei archaeon]|nr:MAG: hypothetical protein DRN04_15530 [Thermoprotei archaeon]